MAFGLTSSDFEPLLYYFFRVIYFTSCHVHSSLLKPLAQNLRDFLPQGCQNRTEAQVCITLIWKEGDIFGMAAMPFPCDGLLLCCVNLP